MSREALRSLGDVVHVLQETIECHKVVKVFGGQDYESARFRKSADPARLQHAPEGAGGNTTPITHARRVRLAVIIYLSMRHARPARHGGRVHSFITAMLGCSRRSSTSPRSTARCSAARLGGKRFRHDRRSGWEDRGTVTIGARGELRYEGVSLPTRRAPSPRSPTSICISAPVRRSRWSVAPAAARPRSSTCFRASTRQPRAASCSTGTTSKPSPRESAGQYRARQPGDRALQRHDPRQHRLWSHGRRGGEEVIAAAEAAHAMEFIRETPEGLKTSLERTARGFPAASASASRSRARCSRTCQSLSWTKATSALDSESERHVQAALEALMRGRTTTSSRTGSPPSSAPTASWCSSAGASSRPGVIASSSAATASTPSSIASSTPPSARRREAPAGAVSGRRPPYVGTTL